MGDGWDRINEDLSPDIAAVVADWAAAVPALDLAVTPQDVIDVIDRCDYAGADQILVFLVEQLQAGQILAGQVLLHCMIPGLCWVVGRAGATGRGDCPEDVAHVVVAECWVVMGSYPVRARPRRVAANLTFDTLAGVFLTLGAHRRVPTPIGLVVDVEDELAVRGRLRPLTPVWAVTEVAPVEQYIDLADVCRWAVDAGVVSAPTADLLVAVYRDRRPRGEVAADLRISQPALRQRCSRAWQDLRAAVAAEAAPISAVLAATG